VEGVVFLLGGVGFGWDGMGWDGMSWVGLGWVGLGWVGLGWVGGVLEVGIGEGFEFGPGLF